MTNIGIFTTFKDCRCGEDYQSCQCELVIECNICLDILSDVCEHLNKINKDKIGYIQRYAEKNPVYKKFIEENNILNNPHFIEDHRDIYTYCDNQDYILIKMCVRCFDEVYRLIIEDVLFSYKVIPIKEYKGIKKFERRLDDLEEFITELLFESQSENNPPQQLLSGPFECKLNDLLYAIKIIKT